MFLNGRANGDGVATLSRMLSALSFPFIIYNEVGMEKLSNRDWIDITVLVLMLSFLVYLSVR